MGGRPVNTGKCLKWQKNDHFGATLRDVSDIITNYAKGDCILKEEDTLKQHRFWAWGAVICMIMVMVTGYKRK